MRRTWAVVAILHAACFSCAVPKVVIVQQKVSAEVRSDTFRRVYGAKTKLEEGDLPLDVPIANFLAQEFDDDGRLAPIVWSLSDPLFRAAAENSKFRGPNDNPTLEQAFDGARQFSAEYTFVVSAWQEGDALMAKSTLYAGKRSVWSDNRAITAASTAGPDYEMAGNSLARTWTQLLAGGPLKSLPQKFARPTPTVDPGPKPNLTDAPLTIKHTVDNKLVIEQAMKLLSTGQTADAINVLRAAVDEEPLDRERRRLLVSALVQMDQNEIAADEARRAAELFPDKAEFRVLAARAWLAAGKSAEALNDLNEAVAREPEGPETRLLLGELQLFNLRYVFALEHFDKALETGPTNTAHFLRGLTRFLNGDSDGAAADMKASQKEEEPLSELEKQRRYRSGARLVQSVAETSGASLRDLIRRLRLNAADSEAPSELNSWEKQLKGACAILEALSAPDWNRASHERRKLALNLLLQTVSDVRSHTASPNEETLSEATINLGEALKHLQIARGEYAHEAAKSRGN